MNFLTALYRDSKFRTKLLIIFVLSSLVPITAIILVSAYISNQNMTNKVNELMVNNLVQIGERVNLNIELYTNTVYQIYQDEQIIDSINLLMDESKKEQAVAYNRIASRLKQYYVTGSEVRSISIICADGNAVVCDFETSSFVNHLWGNEKDLRKIVPYVKADGEPGMVVTPTMTFKEQGNRSQYFHISKRVFDLDHLEQGSIATIVMSIDERVLNKICNVASETGTVEGINFIMDENGTVITFPDCDFSGFRKNPELTVAEFVELSGLLKNRKTAINEYQDPATGWTIYNVYDKDKMLSDVTNATRIYAVIGAVAIGFALLLISLLVRQINQSVHMVVSGIQQVQKGNLDVEILINQKDEIGEIAANFNEMTVKVKQSIKDVEVATDKRRNAEIRALEAQINPHFLYNTLDSINWMAIEHDEYEISKMLRNLGIILRYSVNKSNAIVTVADLADWLDKYICLHQMRFAGVFVYEIYTEESILTKRLYKLLIQPFIENAILHGFRNIEEGGILRVSITGTEDGQMLHIIIEDNGCGMSEEILTKYHNKEFMLGEESDGIGMDNAFARMNMYYGDRASWNLSSIEHMGTVITIRIPAV